VIIDIFAQPLPEMGKFKSELHHCLCRFEALAVKFIKS
jgi:hypothetical protein